MGKILVIADDLTGALDTGVQFSQEGIPTVVTMDALAPLEHFLNVYDVVVIDSETRHIAPKHAYRIVYDIVRAARTCQVHCIYKKTDSTLRGNVGSELTALLEASGETALPFVPAYPKNGRTTLGGVQYLDGVPLAQTIAARDPYNPVIHSFIPDILLSNGSAKVRQIPFGAEIPEDGGILLFDVETEEQLQAIGHRLREGGRLRIVAGCAGFASLLPSLFHLRRRNGHSLRKQRGILIVSGSANPVSVDQVNAITQRDIYLHTLTLDHKLTLDYSNTAQGRKELGVLARQMTQDGCLVIRALDSNDGLYSIDDIPDSDLQNEDELRSRICENIGEMVRQLMLSQRIGNMIVIGGDTLAGILRALSNELLLPICEIAPGVAVSILSTENGILNIVSKSGSFGTEEMLLKALDYLAQLPEESNLGQVQR